MAEVSIPKENQKRLKAKKFRNSMTFAELMAYSKIEAAQYAIDCWVKTRIMWMSAEDFVAKYTNGTVEIKENVPTSETDDEIITDVPENNTPDWTEVKLNKEDLQELLKANNIEFKKTLWNKKLLILAQENGLL